MNIKNRLRNNLIRKIQQLSTDKLTEVTNLLSRIENQFKSKDKTLKFAGTWKDLDKDILLDLTEKLHDNKAKDRQINWPVTEALVDTDILSYYFKSDSKVIERFRQYLKEFDLINISIITYYEILGGLKFKRAEKQIGEFEDFITNNNIIHISEDFRQNIWGHIRKPQTTRNYHRNFWHFNSRNSNGEWIDVSNKQWKALRANSRTRHWKLEKLKYAPRSSRRPSGFFAGDVRLSQHCTVRFLRAGRADLVYSGSRQ